LKPVAQQSPSLIPSAALEAAAFLTDFPITFFQKTNAVRRPAAVSLLALFGMGLPHRCSLFFNFSTHFL
jgi:hypothetical protein